MVTFVYINCRNLLPVYKVIIYVPKWISTDKNTLRQGIFYPNDWQDRRIVLLFFRKKLWRKTCRSGKNPREEPIWCEGFVPLPERIPLLSRREEMPWRVRPLKRQWVTAFAVTRVEPWNTFVSHPWSFRGWVFFIPSPQEGNEEFRIKNEELWCAFGTI